MKNVDNSEKGKSKEKVNRIIYGSISSSLITYIIVMTVLAMAFGFVTYGFTMYQITANNFDYDEAIFIFLCFFVGLYLLLMVLFVLIITNQLSKPLKILKNAIENFSVGSGNHIEYDGPKEFKEMVDSFNDLSDRLNASEEENRRLTEDKNKMLADISHDLKTPLTVISGYATALHDGLIKPDQVNDYLRIIYQKSNRVADLINQFYEYSKLEHPEYKFEFEKLNVAEFLRELLVDMIDELNVNGFEVEVNFPDDEVGYIQGNQMQLRRVFENLIANTVAHTPKGTLLSFDMGCVGEKVLIRYQDNGGGISPEVADRIFEPFVVDDPARTKSGSGLGLSIAKKIIEYHGGTIILEKFAPKEMASYLITLPLYEEEEEKED
ncbi:MAG: HAMP domain-containing histidine kinase [Lachnospiraceae bacterium]|nr:HAMP domain-containing histidine kinase [Lachnospiraceae bacterium]